MQVFPFKRPGFHLTVNAYGKTFCFSLSTNLMRLIFTEINVGVN